MDVDNLKFAVIDQLKNGTEDAIDWIKVERSVRYRHSTLQCKEKWKEIQSTRTACKSTSWLHWEDAHLKLFVKRRIRNGEGNEDNVNWDDASRLLNSGRSAEQCRQRWSVLQRHSLSSLYEWNNAKDIKLIEEVLKHRKERGEINWKDISLLFDNLYTARQCRTRYELLSKAVLPSPSKNVIFCRMFVD